MGTNLRKVCSAVPRNNEVPLKTSIFFSPQQFSSCPLTPVSAKKLEMSLHFGDSANSLSAGINQWENCAIVQGRTAKSP